MKDLPEHELLPIVEGRLRNYTERPNNELWSTIARELKKKKEPKWYFWVEYVGVVITMMLLFFATNLPSDHANKNVGNGRQTTPYVSTIPSVPEIASKNNSEATMSNKPHAKGDRNTPTDNGLLVENTSKSKLITKRPGGQNSSNLSGDIRRKFMSDIAETISGIQLCTTTTNIDSVSPIDKLSSPVKMQILPEEKDKRNTIKKNLSLDLSLTQLLSYRHISPNGTDGEVLRSVQRVPMFSGSRLGWQLSASLEGRLLNRLEYAVGIQLYRQKQQVTYFMNSSDELEVQQTGDGEYRISPMVEPNTIAYDMLNVGVSSALFYILKPTSLTHKIGAGISYQHGTLRNDGEERYANQQSRHLSYQLMYRLQYPITPVLQVYVQPQVTHSFWKSEKLDVPFAMKTYQAGIGIGAVLLLER